MKNSALAARLGRLGRCRASTSDVRVAFNPQTPSTCVRPSIRRCCVPLLSLRVLCAFAVKCNSQVSRALHVTAKDAKDAKSKQRMQDAATANCQRLRDSNFESFNALHAAATRETRRAPSASSASYPLAFNQPLPPCARSSAPRNRSPEEPEESQLSTRPKPLHRAFALIVSLLRPASFALTLRPLR